MMDTGRVKRILDMARWAPSGDNTQPWQFEIISESHVVAHCLYPSKPCVYDLDRQPSQISMGAMLETVAIAATHEGLRLAVGRRPEDAGGLTFDLRFESAPSLAADPLLATIPQRSVQRRPLRMRALTAAEKASLGKAVGAAHDIVWIEPIGRRLQTARLMFDSAKLRLTMPEAYQVHRDVIEWNARYSADRVPDQALGVDLLTLRLMKHVMRNWRRVQFFNRYLAGTLLPRLQMDLLPGIACAAHFVLVARRPPVSVDDHLAAGRALQRLWLTATGLGLQMQPELTPLIFARYARDGRHFSAVDGIGERAGDIGRRLGELVQTIDWRAAVFMGRVGAGRPARARSLRKRLDELVVSSRPTTPADGVASDRSSAAAGEPAPVGVTGWTERA